MKELKIWSSNTGCKLKSSGLSLNQNSNNNVMILYTKIRYDKISLTFTQPNKNKLPLANMIYAGVEEDVDLGLFYKWQYPIPYNTTSFVIVGATASMDVSFSCYKNIDNITSISNTKIVVNKSDNNDVLDASYNGTDVDNLWISTGNNTEGVLKNSSDITSIKNGTTIVEKSKKDQNGNIIDSTYETKADATNKLIESKNYTDSKLSNSNIYIYKGSVATYNDLPVDITISGWVYNVESTGDNYASLYADGVLSWDKLGGSVDLSNYYTKAQTDTKIATEVSAREALALKVTITDADFDEIYGD